MQEIGTKMHFRRTFCCIYIVGLLILGYLKKLTKFLKRFPFFVYYPAGSPKTLVAFSGA